jgi:tetratricopeptide (TPR) repeat protein
VIGLLLITSAIALILGAGVRRITRSSPDARGILAAAVASCVGFTVAAALDWIWELPALPVAFLLLAAVILTPTQGNREGAADRGSESTPWVRLRARTGLAGLAILALIATAVPYLGTMFVRESQGQLRSGERDTALRSANTARTAEPFGATPSAQRALVLEESGDVEGAVEAARAATHDEPTNYRTWLLLARLEAERGSAAEAVDAYETAYAQNPRSIVFFETSPEEFASRLDE